MTANFDRLGVEPGESVEFGPSRLEYIPLPQINVLEQNRQTYPREHILELASSMVYEEADGTVSFEMIHQTTIARLTAEQALAYLGDHNEHYGVDNQLEELTVGPDGLYHILISGHCRRLAIYQNCSDWGIEPCRALVAMSPRDEITFEEALALQIRENFHLRPSPQDDAMSILRYYQLRTRREGVEPTIAACARVLGYSSSKISDALRYARLPSEVREFAEGDHPMLSYSVAVQMFALFKAYRERFEAGGEGYERALELATSSLVNFTKGLIAANLESAATNNAAIIAGKLREITGDAPYLADGLFDVDPWREVAYKNDAAGRKMGTLAVRVLAYRVRHNELTPRERDDVLALAEQLRREQQDQGEQTAIFE